MTFCVEDTWKWKIEGSDTIYIGIRNVMKCCGCSIIFGFHNISVKMTGMDFMGCIPMHFRPMASSGGVRMGFLACGVGGFLMGGIMLLGS